MSNEDKVIHTVSCGTCLFRSVGDGYEVLLVRPHRDRDTWGVPKGHIMVSESYEDCAIRETIEETGLTPLLLHQLQDVKVKHSREHKTVKVWMAAVDTNAISQAPDEENFAVSWHHLNVLPVLHRYQVPLLAEAVKFLKSR